MILQKYTPFGKKQAKGMYFSKYEINKTKIIPQKYTPFGKKQAKGMYFSIIINIEQKMLVRIMMKLNMPENKKRVAY